MRSWEVGTSGGHAGQAPASVHAYELRSELLRAVVWDHGARLVELHAPDRDGTMADVCLRYPTVAEYESANRDHGYVGATLGRFAGRLRDARLTVGDTVHRVSANAGAHSLHGGAIGFDQYVWETVEHAAGSVTFAHTSPDGDQGFPGELHVTVTYRLDGDTLSIDTAATTTADTVFSTTNHAYWNLAGEGTIYGHIVTADPDALVELDDELIPTGVLTPAAQSGYDFPAGEDVGRWVDGGGFDRCLVFDGRDAGAVVRHPASGRVLRVASNQRGLQVYTGHYLRRPFTGLCLEPNALPDGPNLAGFGDPLVRPGQPYHHRAVYAFGVEDPTR